MSQARIPRFCVLAVLAAGFGASGCTHNYYYGNGVPVCTEGPPITNMGTVCEVPAPGTVVAQSPTTILGGVPRARRVVVSEPTADGIPIVQGGSRFSWRRSEPDSVATTRVEGAVSDGTVNR